MLTMRAIEAARYQLDHDNGRKALLQLVEQHGRVVVSGWLASLPARELTYDRSTSQVVEYAGVPACGIPAAAYGACDEDFDEQYEGRRR